MKKNTLWISVFVSGVALVSLVLVVLNIPSDSIIHPFLNEPIVPLVDEQISREISGTSVFDGDVRDTVILPDNSVITAGQVLSDRNIYVPFIKRTNLGGGALWTTILNPVNIDGVNYVSTGTSNNTIQQIIYVNPDLIYVIGSMQARLIDNEDQSYALSGFFQDEQVPIGDDLLVFVASFTDDFSGLTLHGFITPPSEEGNQATVVADATLQDMNTLILTGVTNSHTGLFANAPAKSTFDFVLSLDINDTLELNELFTFENSTYVQPNKINALENGDLIVSGNFQEADGDFADIPLNQLVESPAFIARIDGESFELEWVSSNLLKSTFPAAVTQFLNVLELDNHRLVTIANVWEANEDYTQHILLTLLNSEGNIQIQKLVDLDDREAYARRLLKATTGYWILGAIKDQLSYNIMMVKITPSLDVDFIYEIRGSGSEILLSEPFLLSDGRFILPIGTYSKDQDYIGLANQNSPYIKVYITLNKSI